MAKYLTGNLNQMSASDLRKELRRAAKAANQRLVRLEKKGFTDGVYSSVQKQLGRKRFKENVERLTLNQLRREAAAVRSFLSARTSTIGGHRSWENNQYETAKRKGFKGSLNKFRFQFYKYWSEEYQALFSSDIIYRALTTGQASILDKIIQNAPTSKGSALKQFLKEYRGMNEGKSRPSGQ